MKKRNISIRVHPAGGVILAAAILLFDSRMVLSALGALVLHEGAHLILMRLCGMTDCTIELTPFGGMADVRSFESYPPWKRMICAAAGLFGSALAAWVCLKCAPRTVFWHSFFEFNLSLALLNALPAWPLDGARILTALAAKAGIEQTVRKVLSWITIVVGLLLGCLGLYGVWCGIVNPSLLVIGPYLCYAAHTEQIASKIRRLSVAEGKLDQEIVLPVKIWAGTERCAAKDTFGKLLGKMEMDQYHLLIQIDHESQKIKRIWTEGEMLDDVLWNGRNQHSENVDKENSL